MATSCSARSRARSSSWRPSRRASASSCADAHHSSGGPVWYGQCVYTRSMAKSKERWDFRVGSDTDRLVRHAAETAERTLTDFVIDAAVIEAERVLADRTQFVLDAGQWDRFVELLERPPQKEPGLEKLFSKRGVFSPE